MVALVRFLLVAFLFVGAASETILVGERRDRRLTADGFDG